MSRAHPVIVTITGPSGSGKTVLSNLLNKEGMKTLVSTTTRAPRQGEHEGKDYHFVSREQFTQLLSEGKFIEDVEYNGILYGVSVEEAENAFSVSKPAVLVAEPHGVEQIKKYAENRGWEVLRVFVDSSEDLLIGRLLNRLLVDVSGQGLEDGQVFETFKPWIAKIKSVDLDAPAAEVKEKMATVLSEFVLSSVAKDLSIATDASTRVDAAASRLKSFQYEQKNWVQPMRANPEMYDLVVPLFDEVVQDSVVSSVMSSVERLQKKSRPSGRKP